MGYGGINYDNIDAEAVRKQYEEVQEKQQAEAELANRPWYERIWDEAKNTAEWAYNKAGEAAGFVSATAEDVLDAYYKLGAEREAFLKRGAEMQQQYSPEALAAAKATGDYSMQQQAVSDIQQQAVATQNATATLARAPFRQTARTLLENFGDTEDDGAFGELVRSVKRSDANIEYFMTDAEKLQKARDIEEATGIKAESIIGDTKAFKQAMDIYDFKKKLDNVGGDPQKIYEEFPELKKILDMDPASAAVALHDMDSIRSTHGIIDSFNYMLEQGNIRLEYENIMYKVAMGKATDNDLQRANDLKWQLEHSQKETPSFIDNPLASIAAGIAGSAPMMWQSIYEGMEDFAITEAAFMQAGAVAGATVGGIGAAPGAAAGAGAGAVKTLIQAVGKSAARRQLVEAGMRSFMNRQLGAFASGQISKSGANRAFQYGMFSGMAKPGMGRRFEEYTELKDENGNRILTDEQARQKAFLGASLESGIEMMNFGLVKNALAGKPHFNRVVEDIVRDAQNKAVKKEAARNLFKSKAGDTLKIAATESAEEALQSISDDVIHNDIAKSTNAKTIRPYSAQDIAARAVASAAMAFPAGLGFGIASATGGTVTGSIRTNRAHKTLAQIQMMYGQQARQTMTGTIMMEQLQQAVSESTMSKKSPDIQQKVLREQLKGTQFQTSYIDVEMALKKENGMKDLKELAKVANISNEELQTAVEEKGHILVPSETLAQAKSSPELLDSVSFDAAAPSMARMRETGKVVMEEVEKRTEKAINKQVDLINGIVDKYYPTDDKGRQNANQRDMMTAAIYTNIGNPAEGWKTIRKEQQEKLDAILAPAIKALEEGFGKAGLMEIDDEQGNKKTVHYSENDQWYRDWYKDHKRQPTKAELREMAIAMVTGDPSAPKVLGWVPTNAEEQAAFEDNRAEVEKLQQDIAVLEEIKGKMQGLTGVEMRLIEGLSPEGYEVYRQVYEKLLAMGGSTARQARMGAILTARHADIIAEKISEIRKEKYTAEDYMRDKLEITKEAAAIGGLNQLAGIHARTAPIMELKRAQAMDGNKTPEEIYKETSWVKGRDGKWRFEIPDNLDKIHWEELADDTKKSTSLWMIYDNDDLYEAYPWLKSTPIKLVDMDEKYHGRVSGRVYRHIEINKNISDEEKGKTLIHEIQHLIQEKEKFAVGGGITTAREQVQREIDNIKRKLEGSEEAKDFIQAEQAWWDAVLHGTQEEVQAAKKEVQKIEAEISEGLKKQVKSLQRAKKNLEYALQKNASDYMLYRNLGGEQEARHTSLRAEKQTMVYRAENTAIEKDRALKKLLAKSSPEQQGKIEELKKLENKLETGLTDEEEKQYEKLRNEIDDKLLDAYDKFIWERDTVEKYKEELGIPSPHTDNAVIVFDGQEYSAESTEILNQSAWHGTPHDMTDYQSLERPAYNPRSMVPKVRGGWSEKKILRYLKEHSTLSGVHEAAKLIAEFDSVEELKNHMFFHGSPGGSAKLKPSITMSDREIEHVGGGGYGEKYWGISVTPSKKVASNFSSDSNSVNIYPIILAKNAVVEDNPELTDAIDIEDSIVDYWTRGVDAVWIGDKNAGEQELLILNPRAVVNIGTADIYRVFKLGQKENPLKIKDDKEIAKMLEIAKDYVDNREKYRPQGKPKMPSYFIDENMEKMKPKEQYEAEKAEYDKALKEWEESEQARTYHERQKILRDNILFQSAWHGTPHDFNAFDLGAIGTGEGNQAHGWGLYFAKDREVSEEYKKRLSGWTAKIKRKNILGLTKDVEIKQEDYTYQNRDKLLKRDEDIALQSLIFTDFEKNKAIKLLKKNYPERQKAIKLLENDDIKIEWGLSGKLFEVDIPNNDVLLDEQKTFDEQPEKVRKVILKLLGGDKIIKEFAKYGENAKKVAEKIIDTNIAYEDTYKLFNQLSDMQIDNDLIDRLDRVRGELDKYSTGKAFYRYLSQKEGGPKYASELLNKNGIKGITYEGLTDGRCYVIFDDKAISIIEKYNKQVNDKIQGQTARYPNGKRVVTIMETADESTFIHEMAHVFFYDLEELATLDEASAKELEVVKDWAQWHKGAAAEYKNTPWAKEFQKREQEIIDAEAHGDHAQADLKKREWMQERFARAFELYLRDGQAPSKGLKEVFRKFKKFLRAIYTAFTGDGGRASTPVQRVMDRMIASEEEIEQASLEDRYKDITEAGGTKLFDETEEKTYKRWYKEAEEESKEQLMGIVMKDLEKARQAEFERRVIKEENRKRKELQQEPVYLAEQAVMLSGGNEDIVLEWYPTVEAFQEELSSTKPLEDVLNEWMQAYKEKLDEELIESHFSEENVDACMQRPKYREKLEALKATALSKKMSLINSINAKAKTAIASIEDKLSAMPDDLDLTVDKDSDAVKVIMKAINQLRFSSRWTSAEYQHIESMIRANTKEDISKALKEFKEQDRNDKANEKAVLEANEGKMQVYKELAKSSILKKNISDACNYGYYVREQKKQAHRVQQMINAKRWDMALQAQQQQAFAAAMANESRKMQDKVQKMLDKIKRQLNVRSVKLPKEERYWHRHLAYILRMTNTDANKPESGVPSLDEIFKSMTDSLDLQYSPIDILAIASEDENFKGYKSLQYSQFEDAVDALTILYTTGRDKFRMKTIGGRDIMDVLDEITAGDGIAENVTMQRNLIEEDVGGLGYNEWLGKVPGIGQALAERGQKYLASMLKPEEVLKAIGPAAHKYIFGIYDKAREVENKMVQEEMSQMQELLKDYPDKEKREWTKKKVSFITKEGKQMLTKENIICMALNMGNPANIQRLCGGFGVTLLEVQQIMEENMAEKDWIFVQKMWDHLHSYWKQTVEVEEKLNGVAMKMVEPVGFTIKTSDGKEITLEGGYYPIKYNPKKSSKAQEQDINKAAMGTMSGAQVLGTNRGFTKARAMVEINRPILLDFDVITEHLDNVIHNIAFRLPARDVYRLVSSNAFENYIRDTLGAPYHTLLKQWATDVWNQPKDSSNLANTTMDEIIGFLRRNSVMSIMGYRVWTAIENLSNLGPAMDALGPVHTLAAISNYYFYYKTNKDILMKSVFMANRINQMDRDISAQEGLFRVGMPVFDIIKRHAYDFLLYTDLAISAPLWVQSYKDVFTDKIEEVKKENDQNIKTLQEAQNKVDIIKGDINDAEESARSIEMHLDVRKYGTPEEIERERTTSPFAVRNADELRNEAFEHRKRVATAKTELYKAENDLSRAMDLDIYSDDEIVKEAERRAVAHADAVIRDTFGSGATMDLSSMQRNKNEMVKLMTTFYSFFNTQFNAIYREYMAGKFGDKDINAIRRWAPFAKKIIYRIVIMSLIGAVLKMATGTDGSDEKDKYKKIMGPDGKEVKVEIPVAERFLNVFGKTTLSTATGGLVGVRDVSNMAINYLFDGTTYGRSFNPVSSGFRAIEEFGKVFDLMARKGEKDLEIQAKQEKREREWQERLKKLKGKKRAEAIKKHKEEEKYIKPVKRITYSEIGRHALTGASSLTASYTGISSTLVDSITGTMQYLNDSDGRYDPTWQNIIWSAIFDKKPVERIVPEKPPAPPKKKKDKKKK